MNRKDARSEENGPRLCFRPRIVSILLLLLAAGGVGLWTGCTVGPNYVKPAAEIPEVYKETAGWKVAEPGDEAIRAAWWQIYNDPVLNDLEAQVYVSNQSLAAAEAQFRQARALVQAARAAYYPTISLGASYFLGAGAGGFGSQRGLTTQPGNPSTAGATGTSSGTFSDYILPASVSWEPDLWGRVRRSVEASRASAQASGADLQSIRLLVESELAQNYFQLCALDRERAILDRSVAAYRRFLELTNNRYAAGVASRADVLQAETQLKTTEAQAIDLGVQRAQVEHAIALLAGKPASVFSIPSAAAAMIPPSIPPGIPSQLLERRPDIAAAERRMAAANAQIGVAKAAYYPSITLSASGGFQSTNLSNWLTWPSRFWSLGAGISEIVFEGGLRRAQTNQARAAYEGAIANYRQAVLTAFQEVEDNLAALRILEEESRVQEEAVRSARETVRVTTNQYLAGTLSQLNVIVAQTAALTNERTAVNILNRRMAASVLLIKALGGGWEHLQDMEGLK